ncbi:MAG: hypothetical protein KBS44_01915, partial [Clostridiales bacterium]|nr:hypothetical protein [Candidatus Coliplasma equi]
MKHGSNKNLIIVLSVVLAVLCVGTTFAWLAGNKEIECDDMQGSIITQYFHCGTGTEDDPFVITRPIHYYNLIYLYQRKEGFADENYHFQLGYDIGGNDDGVLDEGEEWLFYSYDDEGNVIPGEYVKELNMAGYSDGVLPIGTSATPFNAIFEGNSLTVKNLKVISSQTINKVDYNTCDIGLFGFIGPNAEISDVYYKNVTIDLTGLDPTTVNHEELHNDDIHEGEVSYVGVIAGHIVDSAICDRVYINDCTILGGAAAKCEFGYFGVVENAETGAPSPQLVESIKELRGAGSNAGFGGSIDMQMLYNRLTAIHRKSYANNYTYRYLTAKNKYVDEVTGDIHYDDFVYDGTLVARNYQAGEGYYSPSEGNFVFGSNNSSSGSGNNRTWPYHYISGINTSSTKYPVTTTVYTIKEDPDNPGNYLSDYGFKFGYNGY